MGRLLLASQNDPDARTASAEAVTLGQGFLRFALRGLWVSPEAWIRLAEAFPVPQRRGESASHGSGHRSVCNHRQLCANSGLMHCSKNASYLIASLVRNRAGSFGQPRSPKALNHRLRVCLTAPSHPRRYREGGIDLKQTSCRFTHLTVTSKMGEGGRENAERARMIAVQT